MSKYSYPPPRPKTEDILASLEPLFEQAAKEKKWFMVLSIGSFGGTRFSPKELRAQHAEGSFIWGPSNWRLIDPEGIMAERVEKIDGLKASLVTLRKRIEEGWE